MSDIDHSQRIWNKLKPSLDHQKLRSAIKLKLIIEFFLNNSPHVAAEFLNRPPQLKKAHLSLIKIHRTPHLLQKIGLMKQKQNKNQLFLESTLPKTHHNHLTCLSCDKIKELT